jgi:hypothetical protein
MPPDLVAVRVTLTARAPVFLLLAFLLSILLSTVAAFVLDATAFDITRVFAEVAAVMDFGSEARAFAGLTRELFARDGVVAFAVVAVFAACVRAAGATDLPGAVLDAAAFAALGRDTVWVLVF